MAVAHEFAQSGHTRQDNTMNYELVKNWSEFWAAFTHVTGVVVEDTWAPFHCSC